MSENVQTGTLSVVPVFLGVGSTSVLGRGTCLPIWNLETSCLPPVGQGKRQIREGPARISKTERKALVGVV